MFPVFHKYYDAHPLGSITLYNQEQQRIAKAREDSLKKLEALRLDSLARADSLRNSIQGEDSLKTPDDNLPGAPVNEELSPDHQGKDTLKNGVPQVNDTLRMNNRRELDSTENSSQTQIDSLAPGTPIKRK